MKLNGENFVLETSLTLEEFLKQQGFVPEKIAAELNGKIVPRREYASTFLTDSDKLEIVCFVGGG